MSVPAAHLARSGLRRSRRAGTLSNDMWRERGGHELGWAVGAAVGVAFQALACGAEGTISGVTDVPPGVDVQPPVPGETPVPVTPPGTSNVSCNVIAPGAAESRLLTRLQYDNTIRDLLGDTSSPAQGFPAENTLLGFGNNADAHRATLLLAERELAAAEALAAAAVARGVDELLPCEAGDRSVACIARFVSDFGYRAFRRPLRPGEGEPFVALFEQANVAWGFDKALELVIQAFLQAPQLLYRTESLARADDPNIPEQMVNAGAVLELDSYQIASRLSYLLWNTMPDAELFELADADRLRDVEVVREQARRMLDDPRARSTVADFYSQWLGASRFSGLSRDLPTASSTPEFNAGWERSLTEFVQHTFWEDGGNVAALLTSNVVFLEPELAPLYGFEPTFATTPSLYTDDNRAGILTQPGLMSLLAHPDQSAPVQRGKFVREQLLCQQLPPPPPDVDTTPPDPDPNATTRERFAQHSSDPRCASCHRLLDPVGFGFESFDHLGRFRAEENGARIDASGNIVGSGDPGLDGAFDGATELASRLAESPQVEACLATQWFRYGMGRAEQEEDVCNLERIKTLFADTGGDFRELLVALATSDAFRYRTADEQDL